MPKFLLPFILFLGLLSCKQTTSDSQEIKPKTELNQLADLYNCGRYPEVIELGNKILAKDSLNTEVMFAVGDAYLAIDSLDQSFELMMTIIDINMEDYYAWGIVGNIFFRRGQYEEAKEFYEVVIKLNPTYARPYINIGMACEAQGKKEEAVGYYLAASYLFNQNSHYEEFEFYTEKVLELDPQNDLAMFQMGIIATNKKDYKQASEWYEKSSDLGNDKAMYNLGVFYMKGLGVIANHKKGIELYTKASKKGNAEAQFNLGQEYHLGTNIKQDYNKASYWLQKAWEQGHKEARFQMGNMENKQGNYARAIEIWQELVKENHALSMVVLGLNYLKGQGVEKDIVEANEWFRKARLLDNDNANKVLDIIEGGQESFTSTDLA